MTKILDLFEGMELSEDFKTKVTTLVETLVKDREDELTAQNEEKIKELEAKHEKQLDESLDESKQELLDSVSSFLDIVVKEWAEENAVAIENGVKVDIAESFLDGMKGLLAEHDIEAPEGQVDMVKSLEEKVESLKADLDKSIAAQHAAIQEANDIKRDLVILEVCEDSTDTEIEKIRSLTEDFDFESEEKFKEKVLIVHETYFKKDEEDKTKGKGVTNEDIVNEDDDNIVSSMVAESLKLS